MIAGIHESVATQKRSPLAKNIFALARGECRLAYQRSGASAKKTSSIRPIGGKLTKSRNPGRSHNTFFSKPRSLLIIADSS